MLSGWVLWFILFWGTVMIGLLAIGGFLCFASFKTIAERRREI